MGTQSEWIVPDLQTPKSVKSSHRIPLVSPRMDVDVTGVSLKNVRTHLIDHPRDEGLKHREQLWNFQQKYRGAVGKTRTTPINIGLEDRKCESSGSDDATDDDNRVNDTARSRAINDQSLLSNFRKRLIKRKLNFTGLRSGEFILDSSRKRNTQVKEPKEEEKNEHPGIQRFYSSGLIVKNTLYKQLRSGVNEEKRNEPVGDNSRILETIQKYGSLEKLPDIVYPGSRTPQPQLRFLKSLSSYNRRFSDLLPEKRYMPLRRTLTQLNDIGSRRKLIIVSRRDEPEEEKIAKLGCIDPYNDDIDDEDDNNNDDNDALADDEEDECDNENQVAHPAKLHVRDCHKKRPEHVDIRCNITHVNTQDDMVLIEKHKQETEETHKTDLRHENTFHGEPRKPHVSKEFSRTDLKRTDSHISKNSCSKKAKESWNSKPNRSERNRDKDESKEHQTASKPSQKKKLEIEEKVDECESDNSLDIPEDRFGHTTHTIDKKLAIRKPWEWKPSPYRWIDKPYIRESDKPYIERIINKGEVIDEFNYDSYARTKPLKLQSFPEGAGYKDRYGNLR
ncbi:hypothetical protein ACF0H5_016931 [Mactra antiquata]